MYGDQVVGLNDFIYRLELDGFKEELNQKDGAKCKDIS